jgi:hypothetical protein
MYVQVHRLSKPRVHYRTSMQQVELTNACAARKLAAAEQLPVADDSVINGQRQRAGPRPTPSWQAYQ